MNLLPLNLAYLAPSLFAFYMLVACNFLAETFSCKLQTLLRTNMFAKHLTGIMLLFFLVVLVKPENADKNIIYNIGLSFLLYIWFMMTTKVPISVFFIILFLLIAVYLLDIRKQRLLKDEKKNENEIKQIDMYENFSSIIVILSTIIGIIFYYFTKKKEYRDKFELSSFIMGTNQCRNSNNYPINNKSFRK